MPSSAPVVVRFREADTPPDLRRQVRAMQEVAWPSEDALEAESLAPVHDPALDPLSLLLVDDGLVLASLDVLRKPLLVEGHEFAAGGLSTVVTAPAWRGMGHGLALAAAARSVMAELGLDLGIFTCDRYLLGFYEAAGWEHLPGTVVVGGTPEAPFPSDAPGLDKVTLGAFFSGAALARRDSFLGARVELYPGTIDRLW